MIVPFIDKGTIIRHFGIRQHAVFKTTVYVGLGAAASRPPPKPCKCTSNAVQFSAPHHASPLPDRQAPRAPAGLRQGAGPAADPRPRVSLVHVRGPAQGGHRVVSVRRRLQGPLPPFRRSVGPSFSLSCVRSPGMTSVCTTTKRCRKQTQSVPASCPSSALTPESTTPWRRRRR